MKKLLLILCVCVYFSFNIIAQDEKWGFLAIDTQENKEYVIGKIKQTKGIRFMGYCPLHQLIVFRYSTDEYQNVSGVYDYLTSNDLKLKEVIVIKNGMDDENVAKEIILHCDFNPTEAINIKSEMQTN